MEEHPSFLHRSCSFNTHRNSARDWSKAFEKEANRGSEQYMTCSKAQVWGQSQDANQRFLALGKLALHHWAELGLWMIHGWELPEDDCVHWVSLALRAG